MNNRIITLIVVASLAALGAAAGGYWFGTRSVGTTAVVSPSSPAERKPLFYHHPMNPEVTSPVPAPLMGTIK